MLGWLPGRNTGLWAHTEQRLLPRLLSCTVWLCCVGVITGCAESVHQTERLARSEFALDPGYADSLSYSYWPGPGYGPGYGIGYGPGYWGPPLGYYGYPYGPLGYGWYGGYHGFGGWRGPSGGGPAIHGPRPTPPANAPPQFKKKY